MPGFSSKVLLGDVEAFIVSASEDRIIVRLPESPKSLGMVLTAGKSVSALFPLALPSGFARISIRLLIPP